MLIERLKVIGVDELTHLDQLSLLNETFGKYNVQADRHEELLRWGIDKCGW